MEDLICPFCGKDIVIKRTYLDGYENAFYYPHCSCNNLAETNFLTKSEAEQYCIVLYRLKNLDPISREVIQANIEHLFSIYKNEDSIESERNKVYQLISEIIHVEVDSSFATWIELYFALNEKR